MHVHLFLPVLLLFLAYVGVQSSFDRKAHQAAAAIFAPPDHIGVGAVEAQPALASADNDLVFAEFNSRLLLAIEAVGCCVAAAA